MLYLHVIFMHNYTVRFPKLRDLVQHLPLALGHYVLYAL